MDTVIGYKLSTCIAIILTTVCFLDVHGQGTPVLTIAQSPITVGDGDQYAELKCQIARSSDYITKLHKLQRKQADLSYTIIATVSFEEPNDTIVNDAVLVTRSNAVWHDPSNTTFAGSLQIRDVICTDAGMYRCETVVLISSTGRGSSFYSTDVELGTIKLPSENPRLSYSPSDINVGDDVQFACNGNVGRPAVDLSIAVSIGSLTPESLPSSGDDLTAADDNCTQTRRVTASRIFTRYEAKSGVIVQCNVVWYPSLVHQRSVDVKYPVGDVEITIDGSNSVRREIDEGRRITVQCRSDGNPNAAHKISFTRTGGTGITQEWSDDRVVIEQLKMTDAGTYFCTAWNTLSSGDFNDSSQNIKLTVTELPPTEAPTTPLPTRAPTQTPKPRGSTDDEPTSNAGMIGGIVFGVLVVIIIIAIIIFIVKRRRGASKQYPDEPPEKPRNNQDMRPVAHAPDLVTNGNNKPSPPPPYDNPQAFDRGQQNLHYADLTFDDKPRSRRAVAMSDSTSPYAEVRLPQV